jgi:Putative Flp pilus-assembly TadE/G-like
MNEAMTGDEGGFVMVWMALMLLVLLAFCGFGIDVAHWWFVGQKEQRAADAAALAGSIYMPNDLPSAQVVALKVAAQNGYKNGVNATVTATQEPQPSRIRVTVRTTITNFFAGLVGYNTQTITRDAVADFQGPVPMGSPTSKLGQDPDDCDPATAGSCANFWLNTSGPKGTKREGDRFATEVCNNGSVAGCAGTVNSEYSSTGYLFRIRVNSIQAGQPLVLQVYDPAWMLTEDFCNNGNMPSNLQQNNIPALTGAPWNITNVVPAGPGNISRYATSGAGQSINSGGTRWCTGDQNAGGGAGNIQNTTYIVRKPDLSPWDDTNNVVAECAPAYFRGINAPLQTLLDPTNVSNDATYVKNYFHRWATVCTIPAANVELGDYVIQVKTNASTAGLTPAGGTFQTWGAGVDPPSVTNNGAGYNRYSMRAGFGTTSGPNGNAPDGTGVSLSATKNLPIYANAGSNATPQFYLARITPTAGSGRTLSLNFYDIGDVGGGSVNVSILAPSDSNYSGGFPICTYHRDDALTEVTAAGCTIPTMTTAVYNGRLTTMTIPIPSNYTCAFASSTGCWLKVGMTYTAGAAPNDTTTWSATLAGDPVRLVE